MKGTRSAERPSMGHPRFVRLLSYVVRSDCDIEPIRKNIYPLKSISDPFECDAYSKRIDYTNIEYTCFKDKTPCQRLEVPSCEAVNIEIPTIKYIEEPSYDEKLALSIGISKIFRDANECVVCLTETTDHNLIVMVPCGHTSVCCECGKTFKVCPICRSRVDKIIEIFESATEER